MARFALTDRFVHFPSLVFDSRFFDEMTVRGFEGVKAFFSLHRQRHTLVTLGTYPATSLSKAREHW